MNKLEKILLTLACLTFTDALLIRFWAETPTEKWVLFALSISTVFLIGATCLEGSSDERE